jgi:hypothetical protein
MNVGLGYSSLQSVIVRCGGGGGGGGLCTGRFMSAFSLFLSAAARPACMACINVLAAGRNFGRTGVAESCK